MINVTKSFLPPFEEYTSILKRAWDKAWLTNNGELVRELEAKLKDYLGVEHLLYTGNGTIVLQMALKAMNITGEVITTPFSYVATTNAILWESCTPVFADIRRDTFCIDPEQVERAITERTQAIMATHVYGLPCDVDALEKIADRYKLKVIYDGAHAFGSIYQGKSLLSYGDISTCSFHATKIFHSVEGGCIICKDAEMAQKLSLFRSFGHVGDDYYSIGINGKNSEFHAAMGLAVLPYLPEVMEKRRLVASWYDEGLVSTGLPALPASLPGFQFNYAYYPVLFADEVSLIRVTDALSAAGVNTRRYFYPSLNCLPYMEPGTPMPVSEDYALRVLALPFYPDLEQEDVRRICTTIHHALALQSA